MSHALPSGDAELITIESKWDFEYRYFAGRTASRFFTELRDHARIMGTRCAKSGRVLVPARSFSDAEYLPTTEWVETGPGGILEIFTIVGTQFPGLPAPPFVIGYVTLGRRGHVDRPLRHGREPVRHRQGRRLPDDQAPRARGLRRPARRAHHRLPLRVGRVAAMNVAVGHAGVSPVTLAAVL